jgi:hypothetical protein
MVNEGGGGSAVVASMAAALHVAPPLHPMEYRMGCFVDLEWHDTLVPSLPLFAIVLRLHWMLVMRLDEPQLQQACW